MSLLRRLGAVLRSSRQPITVSSLRSSYGRGNRSAPLVIPITVTRSSFRVSTNLLRFAGLAALGGVLWYGIGHLDRVAEKHLGGSVGDELNQEDLDEEVNQLYEVAKSNKHEKPEIDFGEGQWIFFPTSRLRPVGIRLWETDDPRWKAMKDFSGDENMKQVALKSFLRHLIKKCKKDSHVAKALGPEPWVVRDLLEFEYMTIEQPVWEQDGFEVSDTGIWYTTRYMSTKDRFRRDQALWPTTMLYSLKMTAQELAGEYSDIARENWKIYSAKVLQQYRRFVRGEKPQPLSGPSSIGQQATGKRRKRKRTWTHELPEDEESDATKSGIDGDKKPATIDSDPLREPSDGLSSSVRDIVTMPKPIRHISHNIVVAALAGKMTDMKFTYTAPEGSVKLVGTVMVRSRKSHVTIKVNGWYDIQNERWDKIIIQARPPKSPIAQRQVGMFRGTKPPPTTSVRASRPKIKRTPQAGTEEEEQGPERHTEVLPEEKATSDIEEP